MLQLDMLDKFKHVFVPINLDTNATSPVTLDINIANINLSGKVVKATFLETKVVVNELTVVDGVIKLPVQNTSLTYGINTVQIQIDAERAPLIIINVDSRPGHYVRKEPVSEEAVQAAIDAIPDPVAPEAQVNADWEAVSGVAEILNKPALFVPYTDGGVTVEDFESAIQKIPYTGNMVRTAGVGRSGYGLYLSMNSGTKTETITLNMPFNGQLSFWYKTAHANNGEVYGVTRILLDNTTELVRNSAPVGWTQYTAQLTQGVHTLDVIVTSGYSVTHQLWLDDITIPSGRVYHQGIFEHANIEPASGNGGKLLAINSEGTEIEYVAKPVSNVQADWNATEGDAEILNKPALFAPYTLGFLTEDFEDTNYVVPWSGAGVRATDFKHSGTYSLKIADGYLGADAFVETIFTIDADADGEVSFWYKRNNEVDTRVNTQFILDGEIISDFKGARDWTKFATNITAGTHTLKVKNIMIDASYCWVTFWVDDFSIPTDKTVYKDIPAMNDNGGKIVAVKQDTTGWEYVDAPEAQVNADWNAVSGAAEILNKPTIFELSDGLDTLVESFDEALALIPLTTALWTKVDGGRTGAKALASNGGYGAPRLATFTLDINKAGILSFWYKATVEVNGQGAFEAKLDGTSILYGVNAVPVWTEVAVPISVGTHTLEFASSLNPSWWVNLMIDDISIPKLATYNQHIFEHSGLPAAVGNSGKMLTVKEDMSGIEYKSIPKGGISFFVPGDLSTGQNKVGFVCPCAMTIVKCIAKVTTAPTDASLIADIHKNGTTIFTTQANRPTIAAAGTSVTTVAPDITTLAEGDLVTIDIDQIGSTVAGQNLALVVEVLPVLS
jgi:opacity protein-like surface antigen